MLPLMIGMNGGHNRLVLGKPVFAGSLTGG